MAPARLLRIDRRNARHVSPIASKRLCAQPIKAAAENQTSGPTKLPPARAGGSLRQSVRLSVLSAQTLKPDASIDWPSANLPCRSTWQSLTCDSLVDAFLPAFTTPSTVVQFAEPGSAAASQTRLALREFVTLTVTGGAAVFALGFADAACASAGGGTAPGAAV